MRQARRLPVKNLRLSRSNSPVPISSTMLSRAAASTKPVLPALSTLSQPEPTHQLTRPQDPPRSASATPAPQSVTLPEASPEAPWAAACGVSATASARTATGSPAGTLAGGRAVTPPTTVRPACPPGSFGSARRARAASSMPVAVRPRSGTAVPA